MKKLIALFVTLIMLTSMMPFSVFADDEVLQEREIGTLPEPEPNPQPQPPTPPVEYPGFADVPTDSWYGDAVKYCYECGLMFGMDKEHFAPYGTLTRAQFVQILAKVGKADLASVKYEDKFSDVPEGKWYTNAVMWAVDNGITAGVGDGLFAPDAGVTRQQLATFLYAYAKKCGYNTDRNADLSAYSDKKDIADWAKTAMNWAVSHGLISGTSANTLSPETEANRAQTAVIIKAFAEKLKDTPKIIREMSIGVGEKDGSTVINLTSNIDRTMLSDIKNIPVTVKAEVTHDTGSFDMTLKNADTNSVTFIYYFEGALENTENVKLSVGDKVTITISVCFEDHIDEQTMELEVEVLGYSINTEHDEKPNDTPKIIREMSIGVGEKDGSTVINLTSNIDRTMLSDIKNIPVTVKAEITHDTGSFDIILKNAVTNSVTFIYYFEGALENAENVKLSVGDKVTITIYICFEDHIDEQTMKLTADVLGYILL